MAVELEVLGHEVVRGESRPYAVYKLLVREGPDEWRLERRWNDLRIAIDQLHRECGGELREKAHTIPKFSAHGFRRPNAMLDASFLDSRAAAMESLLRAYLAALPTSFVNNEGPAALRSLLGQSASAAAGTCDTPWGTPAATPRSTTSGELNVPISLYSPIHEDSGKLKQADQTGQVHEACKKVLFEAGLEKVADGPSPVKGVPVASGSAPPMWAFVAIWASVVILPVVAVLAKEIIY